MKDGTINKRIWELDFLRGVALILMIYFHIVFDMRDVYGHSVDYDNGINFFIGKLSGTLFIFLSGISCMLSRSNRKRGLKLMGLAFIITLVTHLYNPALGIKFGILHFLGVSILLAPLFQKLDEYLLVFLGTCILAANNFISRIPVTYDYFFIFGIYSNHFVSSDYYPLVPWLGVFLYGLVAGKEFYTRGKRLFQGNMRDNFVSKAGRHTLFIYMLHQPVILTILFLFNRL